MVAERYPGEVVVLSSLRDPAVDVQLPPDTGPAPASDPDARGWLHYAPLGEERLAARASTIVDWVLSTRPALVVVDVSVEVALLLRMVGVPVVVVRQHGDRRDRPHRLAYGIADTLLAPYPAWAEDPTCEPTVCERTTYSGGFSRFDGRTRQTGRDHQEVVVMTGTGGTALDIDSVSRLADGSSFRWTVLGLEGPTNGPAQFLGHVADPWPYLCRAGVVVSSAGHNGLCEIAAAGAPAIVVAEDRPFGEQRHKVQVLNGVSAVRVAPLLHAVGEWESVLRDAVTRPGSWCGFVDGRGLNRAVDHVRERAEHAVDRESARPRGRLHVE